MSKFEIVMMTSMFVIIAIAFYFTLIAKRASRNMAEQEKFVDEHNPLDDFKMGSEQFSDYDLTFTRAEMVETHKDPSVTFTCDCCGKGFSKGNVDDSLTREIRYTVTAKNENTKVSKCSRIHLCMHCYWYHFLPRTAKIMNILINKALKYGTCIH